MPVPPPTKPTRRFRPVEVVAVRPVTPRLVQVAFAGDALDGFEIAAPTQHVKLLLPVPGEDAPALPELGPDGIRFPEGRDRPPMRTFTPRRFDAATNTLEVEFVLHGEGPASTWAQQAAPGQGIAVAGPGGRMPLALGPGRWIVAGDESAVPAMATLLGALPATASAQVYVEVEDASDEIAFESEADVTATWRRRAPGSYGQTLAAALAEADVTGVAGVWIACEATAVRTIRRTLLAERGVDAGALVTRGYWRLGEQNHPDHDYGEDAA